MKTKPSEPRVTGKRKGEETPTVRHHTAHGALKVDRPKITIEIFTASDTRKRDPNDRDIMVAYKRRRKEALEAIRRHRRELLSS